MTTKLFSCIQQQLVMAATHAQEIVPETRASQQPFHRQALDWNMDVM